MVDAAQPPHTARARTDGASVYDLEECREVHHLGRRGPRLRMMLMVARRDRRRALSDVHEDQADLSAAQHRFEPRRGELKKANVWRG